MESSRKNNSAVQGASVQQARDASSSADSKAAPSRLHSFIVRAGFGIAYAAIFIACLLLGVLCRCYELVLLLRVLSNDEARRQGPQ